MSDLVSACLALDDWLIWMADACGSIRGDIVYGLPPFVSPYRHLGEFGSHDTSLLTASKYLIELGKSLLPEFGTMIKSYARTGGAFSLQSHLLTLRSTPEDVSEDLRLCLPLFPEPADVSYPTAHQAVRDHFERFVLFIGQIFKSFASDYFRWLDVTYEAFSIIEWNQVDAGRLLAGMEQERRWLFVGQGQMFFSDSAYASYRTTWRPYGDASISLRERANQLDNIQAAILLVLLNSEPQTERALAKSIQPLLDTRGSSAHLNLIAALKRLCGENMVCSGGHGRASHGYRMTPFGRVIAMIQVDFGPECNSFRIP